jgi:hypothetical protein
MDDDSSLDDLEDLTLPQEDLELLEPEDDTSEQKPESKKDLTEGEEE